VSENTRANRLVPDQELPMGKESVSENIIY